MRPRMSPRRSPQRPRIENHCLIGAVRRGSRLSRQLCTVVVAAETAARIVQAADDVEWLSGLELHNARPLPAADHPFQRMLHVGARKVNHPGCGEAMAVILEERTPDQRILFIQCEFVIGMTSSPKFPSLSTACNCS